MLQNQSSRSERPDQSFQHIGQSDDAPRPYGASHDASAYRHATRQPEAHRRAAGLVQALGWFSIGLGIAQLLAPRRISRAIGVGEYPTLMRACGAREVATGVGLLTQRRTSPWLWSRVAGDALDLALLGAAGRARGTRENRIGLVSAAVAGIAVLDLLTSMNAQREEAPEARQVEFEKSIVVNRSPQECYQFWRDFERLPRFMQHLESVQVLDERRSHWKAKGPLGFMAEWDAELTADESGEYMAWRSVGDADVENSGSVRFNRAPGNRGTIVHVEMRYSPPGGSAGTLLAKLFGEEPSQQIDEDLRRFKWLIETGEIPTTIGQPSGKRGAINRLLFQKGAQG
jgi:uncharacterized membrane protein